MPHFPTHPLARSARRVVPLAALLGLTLASIADAQSLRGSSRSIGRMYRYAVRHDLHFYETVRGVTNAAKAGRFVRLTGNDDYLLDGATYPYAKASTRTFVERLASQYRAACGERLVVTSAVRPESDQPANSTARSVHPTGIAVDLRKPRGRCLTWLRRTLVSLERSGVIEATEEFRPPHFHVAVFPAPYARHVARLTREPKGTGGGRQLRPYEVRPGDSLWGIAARHETTVSRLEQINELESGTLVPGQDLLVPDAP